MAGWKRCNGHQHLEGCDCDFGPRARTTSEWLTGYESYVNPNSKCPECNAAVFFYQSPLGGQVYFDELGHPWPKHPCTDRSRKTTTRTDSRRVTPDTPEWKRDGWQPFAIHHNRTDSKYVELAGFIVGGRSVSLHCGRHRRLEDWLAQWTSDTPIFVRCKDGEAVEISSIIFAPNGACHEITIPATSLYLRIVTLGTPYRPAN